MNQVVKDAPNPVAVLRIELQNMEGQFKAALPAHIPVERFMRVVMTALQNNPKLITACTRQSLWNACMKAAQDGLLPDGREGAIVNNGDQASWRPMIAGIRKKVRNSGEIATWDVQVVHAKDKFAFRLGDDPFIAHEPSLDDDPGPTVAAYSIALLKSGEKSRDVMSIGAIRRIRDRSDAWRAYKANKIKSTPWQTDEDEMAKKTVARRHSKVLPMSTDLDDLLRRDDDLYDFEKPKEEAREAQPTTLSGRLDALAAMGTTVETAGSTVPADNAESDQSSVGDADDSNSSTQAPPVNAGTAAGQPAPETLTASSGGDQATAASPASSGAGTAGPQGDPTDEASYEQHALTWIENGIDPDKLEAQWPKEKAMRNRCNVSPTMRDGLAARVGEKVKALRGNAKAAKA